MDRQIARKHLQALKFKYNLKKVIRNASEETITFCENLFSPRRLTRHYDQIENVTFCGKATLTNIEKNYYLAYKNYIYKGTIYHTLGNVYNKKNDDSCIQLKSGKFIVL